MPVHTGGAAGTSLSVIVPVHNARSTIGPCLDAVLAAVGDQDEVIVVDDGSTDGGVPPQGDRVRCIRLATNVGRGPARNVGAEQALGEVLVFVDSDVVVHADALEAVRAAFAGTDRSSLIGAYDDQPGAPGLVSQYRNLLHHRTHLTHGPTAMHFWTGIGAVRTEVFRKVGGLDETDWARDMEDVEFGHRLVDEGFVIDVLPHIQGSHLKRFTLRSMVTTDLVHRAVPWASLMLQSGFRRNDFVLSARQTLSVVAAFGTAGAVVGAAAGRLPRSTVPAGAAVFLLVNAPLWRFFHDKRGWAFAAGCVPLHAVHSMSSGSGFAAAVAMHAARSARSARSVRTRAR